AEPAPAAGGPGRRVPRTAREQRAEPVAEPQGDDAADHRPPARPTEGRPVRGGETVRGYHYRENRRLGDGARLLGGAGRPGADRRDRGRQTSQTEGTTGTDPDAPARRQAGRPAVLRRGPLGDDAEGRARLLSGAAGVRGQGPARVRPAQGTVRAHRGK